MHNHKRVHIGPSVPLSDVLASDGVARPVIGPVRRFDYDDRTGADLERAATALLRNAGDLAAWNLAPEPYTRTVVGRSVDLNGGEPVTTTETVVPGMYHVDTIHRYTRMPQVAPDQLARHGETRYERPSPARYRGVSKVLYGLNAEPSTPVAIELRDTGVPGTEILAHLYRTDVVGHGYAFIGHRATRVSDDRAIRTTSAKPRKGTTGRKPGNVWTIAESNVRRRWSKATQEQRDHARHLAATIRERGSVIVRGVSVELTLAPRERVTIVAGDERLTGGSFTLDDYVRRATLESVK